LISPEQVRALPWHLIDAQVHTHSQLHHLGNQEAIAMMTGNPTRRQHFCYPTEGLEGVRSPFGRYPRSRIGQTGQHSAVAPSLTMVGAPESLLDGGFAALLPRNAIWFAPLKRRRCATNVEFL
jgi:hypothetical protein